MEVAIEVKASSNIKNVHLKGLRELIKDQPQVKQRIIVCLETLERITEDNIHIMPATVFCQKLWDGKIHR